jgi:hypothetical protein
MGNIYSGFPRTLPVTFSETILPDLPLKVGLGASAIMPSCMSLVPPWYCREAITSNVRFMAAAALYVRV